MHEFPLKNLEYTNKLAKAIAKHVEVGDVITLKGELGVGKTEFARYFINSFFKDKQEILSPTFTLVQVYNTKLFPIWHFDLYRLKSDTEAYEIGVEDAFLTGVSLIEWADVIVDTLPKDRIDISLYFEGNENSRIAKLDVSGKWKHKLLDIIKEFNNDDNTT